MRVGIFGLKVGMTQIFDEKGSRIPVTVVNTSDCYIVQVKTKDKEGYNALQLAFGFRKLQNATKARVGHFKKAGVSVKARVREFRCTDSEDMSPFKAGQKLTAKMFVKGDWVDVIGSSKGKGFTGVMKRFGYKGKDATHGTSKYFRHGGSSGSNTFPGRVLKNKGMPGHSGDARATIQNVEIVDVRPSENLILIRGAVPGPRTGHLLIRSTLRRKGPESRPWVETAESNHAG